MSASSAMGEVEGLVPAWRIELIGEQVGIGLGVVRVHLRELIF